MLAFILGFPLHEGITAVSALAAIEVSLHNLKNLFYTIGLSWNDSIGRCCSRRHKHNSL